MSEISLSIEEGYELQFGYSGKTYRYLAWLGPHFRLSTMASNYNMDRTCLAFIAIVLNSRR